MALDAFPALTAVASGEDLAQSADGPATLPVEEMDAAKRRGFARGQQLPRHAVIGAVKHNVAWVARDPHPAVLHGEAVPGELRAHRRRLRRRFVPTASAIIAAQHQPLVTHKPTWPVIVSEGCGRTLARAKVDARPG